MKAVAGTTLTPDAKCRAASAASEKTRRLGVAQRQTSNMAIDLTPVSTCVCDRQPALHGPVRGAKSANLNSNATLKRVKMAFIWALQSGQCFRAPYKVPGGALTAADFRKAAEAGGFTGNIIVGTDLAGLRIQRSEVDQLRQALP